LSWGRHADAALKRIRMFGRLEARMRHDMGVVQAAEGEFAAAREALEASQALFEKEPATAWWLASVHRELALVNLAEGRIADARFERDRFEEFCARHLAHLDEVAWEFFATDAARTAVRRKVEALFPAHEVDTFTELFWARIQEWRRDEEAAR
jgi:hypothetical protein